MAYRVGLAGVLYHDFCTMRGKRGGRSMIRVPQKVVFPTKLLPVCVSNESNFYIILKMTSSNIGSTSLIHKVSKKKSSLKLKSFKSF